MARCVHCGHDEDEHDAQGNCDRDGCRCDEFEADEYDDKSESEQFD